MSPKIEDNEGLRTGVCIHGTFAPVVPQFPWSGKMCAIDEWDAFTIEPTRKDIDVEHL